MLLLSGGLQALPDDEPTVDPPAQALAQSICTTYGGQLVAVFDKVGSFQASMTEAQARAMSHDANVTEVVADITDAGAATIQYTPSADWGLDRIDQYSWLEGLTGAPYGQFQYTTTGYNINAYVLDSGIDVNHPEFGGRAVFSYNACRHPVWGWEETGRDDVAGHGTRVASIIGGTTCGVAKNCKLFSVKCCDDLNKSSMGWQIRALNWVASKGVKPGVVNMSTWVRRKYNVFGATIVVTGALDAAVRNVIARGFPVVVCAGNGIDNNGVGASYLECSPASVDVAITVGSIDRDNRRSSFSNYGPGLDIFAPGSLVHCAVWTGTTPNRNYQLSNGSGTSFATPYVAGVVCQYLQINPSATPAQASAHIGNTSAIGYMPSPGPGQSGELLGSPNRILFTNL